MLLNEMLLYHKILIYLLLLCSISGYMLSLWGDIGRIKIDLGIYTFGGFMASKFPSRWDLGGIG